jgi:biopolymer transport protein ExbB
MYTILLAAGWPVWPLLITSVLALAILIERSWYLQKNRISPKHLITGAIQVADSGALQNTANLANATQTLAAAAPMGQLLACALAEKSKGNSRDTAMSQLTEVATDISLNLERYLGALSTIATLAPLLGLFGTVVGMIEIFGSSEGGATNPQQLAHGISIALYNTAFGLLIAIPSYAGWKILKATIARRQRECETGLKQLLDHLYR